jgi:hypothetical protein
MHRPMVNDGCTPPIPTIFLHGITTAVGRYSCPYYRVSNTYNIIHHVKRTVGSEDW